jgi:hypothetical protein
MEIAFLIHQANPDKGHIQIAGRLEVISRQKSEASGINWQTFGDTEFKRIISDSEVEWSFKPVRVASATGHIIPELLVKPGHVRQEALISLDLV